jgi:hypothetical protein
MDLGVMNMPPAEEAKARMEKTMGNVFHEAYESV